MLYRILGETTRPLKQCEQTLTSRRYIPTLSSHPGLGVPSEDVEALEGCGLYPRPFASLPRSNSETRGKSSSVEPLVCPLVSAPFSAASASSFSIDSRAMYLAPMRSFAVYRRQWCISARRTQGTSGALCLNAFSKSSRVNVDILRGTLEGKIISST